MEVNKIYNMDNLELLKEMYDESVDLIYCDILYNTGKKFKDYDDKLGTPQQAIEWYRPRLIEMKRVLKNTGSIYLQCDYRLVHYLKVEMDKVFGIKNFRNHIIWQYRSGGASKKQWTKKHDDILFYSMSDKWTYNIQYDKIRLTHNYGFKEIKDTKGEDEDGFYYLSNAKDIWYFDIVNNRFGEKSYDYDTQKPKPLLERIIKASSNENDIVVDFFCGSGTSMVVAKELGRKYIGCDINPRAVEITNKRLNEVDK